ncbi:MULTISPECIES: CRISPR-associated endoribonuclease Cas6 [Aeribacillus]|jgi:CRISPR-associated endoribonuclease Cas6|uniref:CRISPR associated protein Cas6 C-terminal domain-containing protein n=2 Tax=Aeribacillus TaxID=1055323 RepID=A0A165Y173_9BACI|nr:MULTISPECIES: CRISPR-associated endoribonuclease Cas6 [Aeribacillus]KZN96619.1 hypothetical protein AZI98_07815 [Aeribacillus pallidus]MDR9798106.1 CRISPR-associated endoribonuclease Cas6 [Aeribacillus pallidus]MED0717348.1 CRISPR-associated endoribonuclease Cas6 [Aeribacillus composti]MED0747121.1 CRISPR-associated endoribonuclease Cas6 [Aeribacillus composti]MED1443416.1 CRISPR-associated endoribonuclease Cas6 [Aeribacillus composti]
MRLRCQFEVERLPVAYRMMFVSLIKESIKRSAPTLYESLYFFNGKPSKNSKHFSTALFLPKYKLIDDEFHIEGKISFLISTPDYEFFLHLYNGLQQIQEFTYQTYTLHRGKITLLEEKQIDQIPVYFKTLSPIYIRDAHNRSIAPDDPAFERELNYIANLLLKNFRGHGLKQPLQVLENQLKKTVVKEKIREFDHGYLYFTAYKGNFCLNGDIDDLRLLSQLGIGFRRNQSFGMVEVI